MPWAAVLCPLMSGATIAWASMSCERAPAFDGEAFAVVDVTNAKTSTKTPAKRSQRATTALAAEVPIRRMHAISPRLSCCPAPAAAMWQPNPAPVEMPDAHTIAEIVFLSLAGFGPGRLRCNARPTGGLLLRHQYGTLRERRTRRLPCWTHHPKSLSQLKATLG